MQNINSVMKEAEVNLAEKARALQRVMDELCLKGANNTFAIGSSHIAVHGVCESNDLPSAMALVELTASCHDAFASRFVSLLFI